MANKKSKSAITKTFTCAQIDGAIVAVAKEAGSLQQKIHNVAVSILKVWHDSNGDVDVMHKSFDRLNSLQAASPYHANAFATWVGVQLPMAKWSDESKAWYAHSDDAKLMGKVFIAARDNPFWKVAPAPKVNPLDLSAEIARLIKKAEKRIDDPVDGDVIDMAAMKFLREARDVQPTLVVA
jgi:hypothetical protein